MKKSLSINSRLILSTILLLLIATPAYAHHGMGGETPNSFLAGLISGLAHPIIGLDHLAFVIGVGFLASFFSWGMTIPLSFVLTSILGTVVHLMNIDLPLPELIISLSVFVTGILLTRDRILPQFVVISLAVVAGIFHGYAYGESIIGAQTTPLISYLAGFAIIQSFISFTAYQLGKYWQKNSSSALNLKFVGYLICGMGIIFTAGFFGV